MSGEDSGKMALVDYVSAMNWKRSLLILIFSFPLQIGMSPSVLLKTSANVGRQIGSAIFRRKLNALIKPTVWNNRLVVHLNTRGTRAVITREREKFAR